MDNYSLDITVETEGAEPVTLDEARKWLRLDVSEDDNIVAELITTARQVCEGFTNISFVDKTITAYLQIGLDEIRFPYGPIKSITSVTNFKGDPISGYETNYKTFKSLDPTTQVIVSYTTGYENEMYPKAFKTAVLTEIAWLYTNRGDEQVTETLSPIAKKILAPYRRVT